MNQGELLLLEVLMLNICLSTLSSFSRTILRFSFQMCPDKETFFLIVITNGSIDANIDPGRIDRMGH